MKTFTLTKDRIEFTDARFYLSDNGNYVPSVTTILDAFPKSAEYFAWIKKYGEDAQEVVQDYELFQATYKLWKTLN